MHAITTFYHFFRIDQPEQMKQELNFKAKELGLQGLIICGPEGLNATLSCSSQTRLESFKSWLREKIGVVDLNFKDSESEKAPFRRFVVKVRDEIVTLGNPDLFPDQKQNHHLSPTQWNEVLKNEKDLLLIDTRNWYETKIGTFKGAKNPHTDKFTEFPKFMQEQNADKNQKVLIFCTGGIRCEKGILELQRQGYENVYQLEGGILNYLKEYPNDQFEGECFVFDHRVAVDQNLKPTENYDLCPHCGQPAASKIQCSRCDYETLICEDCLQVDLIKETCSKNCAHHYGARPGVKGPRQIPSYEQA